MTQKKKKSRWDTILDRFEEFEKIDNLRKKSLNEYLRSIDPDSIYTSSYPSLVSVYLDGIFDGFNFLKSKEKKYLGYIKEYFDYYYYEAREMKGSATVTTKNGTRYNFKKRSDFIKFLEKEYPL